MIGSVPSEMPTNLTGTGFINHGSAVWIRKIWMRDRIYNYMRGYRYKARYRIQENWGTDTKQGTGFKKIQGTDTKTKIPRRYRTKKNAVLHKQKLKGWNRHQNKKFWVPVLWKISLIYLWREVSSRVDKTYGFRKFYLPEVQLCRSRGGGSGIGTGSCGDLFGRTAPLLGQATNRARRAKTRRLHKIK